MSGKTPRITRVLSLMAVAMFLLTSLSVVGFGTETAAGNPPADLRDEVVVLEGPGYSQGDIDRFRTFFRKENTQKILYMSHMKDLSAYEDDSIDICSGDFNGDGIDDIAILDGYYTSNSQAIWFFKYDYQTDSFKFFFNNEGDSVIELNDGDHGMMKIAAGDIDGYSNGRDELVILDVEENNARIIALRNYGGTFSSFASWDNCVISEEGEDIGANALDIACGYFANSTEDDELPNQVIRVPTVHRKVRVAVLINHEPYDNVYFFEYFNNGETNHGFEKYNINHPDTDNDHKHVYPLNIWNSIALSAGDLRGENGRDDFVVLRATEGSGNDKVSVWDIKNTVQNSQQTSEIADNDIIDIACGDILTSNTKDEIVCLDSWSEGEHRDRFLIYKHNPGGQYPHYFTKYDKTRVIYNGDSRAICMGNFYEVNDPLLFSADEFDDIDHDGLVKCEEDALGTNPGSSDSDNDGLFDGFKDEDPYDLTFSSGEEMGDIGDMHGHGGYWTDPLNADTDGDGLWDGEDVGEHEGELSYQYGAETTNPLNPDSDGDGLWDGWNYDGHWGELTSHMITVDGEDEYVGKTNPNDPDTDNDGLWDGWVDNSHDGYFNGNDEMGELGDSLGVGGYGSNPKERDTDEDGMWDKYEIDTRNAGEVRRDPTITNNRYAILLGGGYYNDFSENFPYFWISLFDMYMNLRDIYNYKDENIYFLYTNGREPNCVAGSPNMENQEQVDKAFADGRDDESIWIRGPCTENKLEEIFETVGGLCTPNDDIIIYTSMHGGVKKFCLWDHPSGFSTSIIAGPDYLGKITHYSKQVIQLNQCYSGSNIEDLQGDRKVIMTCEVGEEPSHTYTFGVHTINGLNPNDDDEVKDPYIAPQNEHNNYYLGDRYGGSRDCEYDFTEAKENLMTGGAEFQYGINDDERDNPLPEEQRPYFDNTQPYGEMYISADFDTTSYGYNHYISMYETFDFASYNRNQLNDEPQYWECEDNFGRTAYL